MLKTKEYEIPDDLLYTKEHEWARQVGGLIRIGITDYAAKTLNDVVYLSLPSAGQDVKQFAVFGTVESIKAVSELYSPLSGNIQKVNAELDSRPELVNQAPYEAGWIIELRPFDLNGEKKNLLAPQQYADYLTALDK